MSEAFVHRPVLGREVVELLSPVPAGTVVDATVGGGGHAGLLLEARPDLRVLGIDRDDAALTAAARALERFGDRVQLVRAEFSAIASITTGALGAGAATEGDAIVGVLFDLGVSSPQLDRAERGFSYWADAPARHADGRAPGPDRGRGRQRLHRGRARAASSPSSARSASPAASPPRSCAAARSRPPATSSTRSRPRSPRRRAARGGHPARRTFQAIRMEVNRELPNLREGLDDSVHLLTPGGRVLVLAYHSLEDRIVKRRFADWSGTAPRAERPAWAAGRDARGAARPPDHPQADPAVRGRARREPARRRACGCARWSGLREHRHRGRSAPHPAARRAGAGRVPTRGRATSSSSTPTRRRREQRRRWIVRVWAVGIVAAALVGVMVHAFMAEGQLQVDRARAAHRSRSRRATTTRASTSPGGAAPRVIAARAARLGLVPGSGTRTVAVPGRRARRRPIASKAATARRCRRSSASWTARR